MASDLDLLLGGAIGPASSDAEVEAVEVGPETGLEVAAEEFIAATQAGDAKGVAAAFRSMFDVMQAAPVAIDE